MAYDKALAERIRTALAAATAAGEVEAEAIAEQPMFGGLSFLLAGNMCCGASRQGLMVRVGPDQHEQALAMDGARPMDFTGRPMRGMVFVDPSDLSDDDLTRWVMMGIAFAGSLPPKKRRQGQPS